jgi:hypothetical protein
MTLLLPPPNICPHLPLILYLTRLCTPPHPTAAIPPGPPAFCQDSSLIPWDGCFSRGPGRVFHPPARALIPPAHPSGPRERPRSPVGQVACPMGRAPFPGTGKRLEKGDRLLFLILVSAERDLHLIKSSLSPFSRPLFHVPFFTPSIRPLQAVNPPDAGERWAHPIHPQPPSWCAGSPVLSPLLASRLIAA